MLEITLEAVKNLKVFSSNRDTIYGNFSIGREVHRQQCENLEIGDKVFFLVYSPNMDSDVSTKVEIVQAMVVEQQ